MQDRHLKRVGKRDVSCAARPRFVREVDVQRQNDVDRRVRSLDENDL